MKQLLINFRSNRSKHALRATQQFIRDTKFKIEDSTIGIASNTSYVCNEPSHLPIPLTESINIKPYIDSNGQQTAMDFDINVKAVLNQFYLGIGPRAIAGYAAMLDLPNAKKMLYHCNRRQGVIGEKLIRAFHRSQWMLL